MKVILDVPCIKGAANLGNKWPLIKSTFIFKYPRTNESCIGCPMYYINKVQLNSLEPMKVVLDIQCIIIIRLN